MNSVFCVAYFSAETWLLAETIFVNNSYTKTSGPTSKLLCLLKPKIRTGCTYPLWVCCRVFKPHKTLIKWTVRTPAANWDQCQLTTLFGMAHTHTLEHTQAHTHWAEDKEKDSAQTIATKKGEKNYQFAMLHPFNQLAPPSIFFFSGPDTAQPDTCWPLYFVHGPRTFPLCEYPLFSTHRLYRWRHLRWMWPLCICWRIARRNPMRSFSGSTRRDVWANPGRMWLPGAAAAEYARVGVDPESPRY